MSSNRTTVVASFLRRSSATGLIGALAISLLAACSSGETGTAGSAPPPVSVATALTRNVRPTQEFTGRIEAIGSVDLRPRVSGYIESVSYVEGEEVEEGDVLFVIDDRSYRVALARATAELERARTRAELARVEAERAELLVGQQAISTEAWEERRAESQQAVAEMHAAQAAVERARLDLEWTRVRAPIAGRAGRAFVTRGNLVTPENRLTTLVTLDEMHVYFDVDEATFLRFVDSQRDGDLPVRVGLIGDVGYPHGGRVDFLDNRMSRQTGTITLRAVLDNAERLFTPGLFARVQLPVSERFDAVLIDDRAVLTDQDRKYVFVVDPEGNAVRRDVQLGGTADGLRIVQSGLAAGDRVVIEGGHRITRPGMPVNALTVDMAARAAPDGRVAVNDESAADAEPGQ